jgi:hypothetical protein
MATNPYAFVEQNTEQSTALSSYGDVTGLALASNWAGATLSSGTGSGFTTGKKYLLVVTAQISENSTGVEQIKVLHGSTDFADSEAVYAGAAGARISYMWFGVWTAVAGEGIKVQFAVSAGTMVLDQASILAIDLSSNLTENTDWFINERGTDDALTGVATNGGAITFTPTTASQNWLVLSMAQIDHVSGTAIGQISALVRSGEAASSTPATAIYATTTTQIFMHTVARVFSLGAASNTFTEQSSETGADAARLHSKVFALNLAKFRTNVGEYTDGTAALSATDYATELETASITPAMAGDVWIGAYWTFDQNNTGRSAEYRVQVDGSDQPAGQTTDNYSFLYNALNAASAFPMHLSTMATMTAAAHTIDLDASADSTTGTPNGMHRQLWAVTMELVASDAIPASPGIYRVNVSGPGGYAPWGL